MSRARNIKPGFFKNEDLAECSVWARLLFPGLWMLADREGRLEDRPRRIKGELFPFDSIDVEPLLAELEAWHFIRRYSVADVCYILVCGFGTHQNPHGTEKDSQIPDENGYLTVHTRGKNACITGHSRLVAMDLPSSNVAPTLDHMNPPEPNALIPDSLIPDSLIPDSLIQKTGRATSGSDANSSSPAESLCARLILDGVTGVNATNPKLLALLAKGLTVDELAAIGPEAARGRKSFAWLLGAAEGRRRDAAEVVALPTASSKPWFVLASGIEAKGIELGIDQLRDEHFPLYKARVLKAAHISDDDVRRANQDFAGKP